MPMYYCSWLIGDRNSAQETAGMIYVLLLFDDVQYEVTVFNLLTVVCNSMYSNGHVMDKQRVYSTVCTTACVTVPAGRYKIG